MKKAAILFTGGKDSCLALLKAKQKYDIKYLLTILPSSSDSYMFHKPSLKLLRAQSKSLEIPLIIQKSISKKESELEDLEKLTDKVKDKIQVLMIGGIASSYQARRIKKVAEKCGLEVYAPLWNYAGRKIWKELLENNFKVILTKITCEGLPKEFLGKVIDKELFTQIKKLSKKYKFRVDFEGGEAETAVLWMPGFSREVKVLGKIESQGGYRHFFIIEKVNLINKN